MKYFITLALCASAVAGTVRAEEFVVSMAGTDYSINLPFASRLMNDVYWSNSDLQTNSI